MYLFVLHAGTAECGIEILDKFLEMFIDYKSLIIAIFPKILYSQESYSSSGIGCHKSKSK